MPREPVATSETSNPQIVTLQSSFTSHHGPAHQDPIILCPGRSVASSSRHRHRLSSPSRSPGLAPPDSVHDGLDADQLDEKLSVLSIGNVKGSHPTKFSGKSKFIASPPGQRIVDYENALTPHSPRQATGYRVIKPSAGGSRGTLLTDMPNEILTNILLHLHPDSHDAVALVSKRFYELVTTSHIWRLAFSRYFPGHASLQEKLIKSSAHLSSELTSDFIRCSETRYFARLTPLATWKSEFVFRTRLIRSLAKGKPNISLGAIASSDRANHLAKKSSAALTYNSKLPWLITNIHAVFENGKKPPRAIQGSGILGIATMSDPTTGKIDSWGLKDSHSSAQIDQVTPGLVPYGLGHGPAATDNSMDVSQLFGIIAGQGFPGGRPYFRSGNEGAGRYLGSEPEPQERQPDIPLIPQVTEAISSVWIAKSSAIPSITSSMCGMLVGSTLGVVTAYSLGSDPNGRKNAHGHMTARWVLSPGVPIVSIKVDQDYTVRRSISSRVWAVVLNALGEVFYLIKVPKPMSTQHSDKNALVNAWRAGRSVYWHLVEETRRSARHGEQNLDAIRHTYSPRTPTDAMNLSDSQITTEAREIEKYMRYQPTHFRSTCAGWDMQRKLEVDFACDDGKGAGEAIFVIDCGHSQQACITRYCRSKTAPTAQALATTESAPSVMPSLFGQASVKSDSEPLSPGLPPLTSYSPETQSLSSSDEWHAVKFELKVPESVAITASALDGSAYATLTLSEDVLHTANQVSDLIGHDVEQEVKEIPGRRARFLTVGTNSGGVFVWNAREQSLHTVRPCRIIQTESPSVTCVAASSLYLVHGGSDGLVQAWDPLASTLEPIRTLNARSHGRAPRYMTSMAPMLPVVNYSSVGSIFLDSDPTALRGVVAFGACMRYWSYSSRGSSTGQKRRLRYVDAQDRVAGRRCRSRVSGYIVEEEKELRQENEHRAREQTRLRKRFGVGALGDLTEQEALEYMQMISEETCLADEVRRASDPAADTTGGDSASTGSGGSSTADVIMSEASPVESSSPLQRNLATDEEEESGYQDQMQQAIRLSLLEGVGSDDGQSPHRSKPDEFAFSITYKAKGKAKSSGKDGGASRQSSPSTVTPTLSAGVWLDIMEKMDDAGDGDMMNGLSSGSASASASASYGPRAGIAADEDADLALAISLSIQEEARQGQGSCKRGASFSETKQRDFPPLPTAGGGGGGKVTTAKGKEVAK